MAPTQTFPKETDNFYFVFRLIQISGHCSICFVFVFVLFFQNDELITIQNKTNLQVFQFSLVSISSTCLIRGRILDRPGAICVSTDA